MVRGLGTRHGDEEEEVPMPENSAAAAVDPASEDKHLLRSKGKVEHWKTLI